MITITFYATDFEDGVRLNMDSISGFHSIGHAGYARAGKDIICSAVSALVTNTMNSIHQFTKDVFSYDEDPKAGKMDFKITSAVSPESRLLLKSLLLGLSSIQDEYGEKYLHIAFQNS